MNQNHDVFLEDLYDIQAVCVYGEGDSSFYAFLKEWVEDGNDRKIIFLEDDEKKYLEAKKIVEKQLSSKNYEYILMQTDLEQNLKQIAWNCSYLNLKILKSNNEKRIATFEKVSKLLNELHLGVNVTSYLYADFGINNFENIYNNLINSDSFIILESLADKFKNIPAIIAGAGPSLDKNIHFLKDVYDKALIFAGGSALNIFSKKNIRHHCSGFIDQSHLFKRFKNNLLFENLFFYSNQMSHHNFSIVQANKVLTADYGAYPLERWIYDQLDIKQKVFEAGWNVTTFLIKIAAYMGCNPICFVGLDLSFKKNKYAKGVEKTKKLYDLVKVKNASDDDLFTQKDWLLAKKWIEEFALCNKEIKFINATEGGLKLENIDDIKLSGFVNNLNKTQDLSGYVHSVYEQQQKIKLNKENIYIVLKKIQDSLKNSDTLCDQYLLQMENHVDENLMKLQKEIVYVYLLDPLWQIWKYVILRNVENITEHILINKLLFFKNVIAEHLKILGTLV